ncbi:LysR family transcriptional regulator [Pseudonocardia sp. C8]|uniref:LysR family transcriptional regulator n=1 Tax=Pseudonocardia sp. C8 TaxID=2762759 RepID=UPI0016433CE7|nr:LysR family transcriptional regulator [Pseudonocardia sp. C8]
MDLRLVEYFVAVIDHGGITRAAHALYISQPSLSAAIRSLENELGVPLFDRGSRRLRLTPAGAAFQEPARRVLREAAQARAKVGAVRDLRAGRLHVAAMAALSVDPLPGLVHELRLTHPGVQVHVTDPGSPAGVVAEVRQGRAELGLTSLPARADALATEHLWTQRVVLAATPELARDLPDPFPLEQAHTLPLVLEVGDRLTAVIADPELRDVVGAGAIRCAHRQAIWELVMQGAGATFLPAQLARRVLRGVEHRATDPEVLRRIGLVYRPGGLSPAASAFLEVARATAAGP